MAELLARGIVVDRGTTRALDGIDLAIERGELVAVMGGTGAGKSTLALALAGLAPLTAGGVDGDAAGAVGLVLQRPEATFLADVVLDEVALAAIARGAGEEQAAVRASTLLTELGLPRDAAHRDPLALSGGEQRRVAIAAALAGDPRVLVLDEPAAGLDRAARAHLHDVLRALHAAGRTIVVVTHDPDEAAEVATRLVVLRDGRIAWDGPPGVVLGDPVQAAAVGLAVAPEVELLHRLVQSRGMLPEHRPWRAGAALDEVARLLAAPVAAAGIGARSATSVHSAAPTDRPSERLGTGSSMLPPLPPLVDARVRIVACAVAVAAALLAQSLVAAGVVVLMAALVVALARIGRARVRLAVRPLMALAAMLVLLQVVVGGAHEVPIVGERVTEHPAATGALRSLQAAAVVLATLALSGATAVGDLAAGMRHLLAPLRLVRVPVGTIAFVVATGLGLVPTFADELERLRLAQRARGIRPVNAGPVARLRADAQLVAPLFVAAFRRAHLLADALTVRGVDPDTTPADWRARRTPDADVALLAVAAALLAVTRFA